eukprot:Colp12_sorted_trinity150504_noHs@16535
MLGLLNICRAFPNRAKRGLYGGKGIQFGNNVSFAANKTRRRWNPNAFSKRLYSEILNKMIPLKVTAYALRWIDKVGGLDNYILKTSPDKLKSDKAMQLRGLLQRRLAKQQK